MPGLQEHKIVYVSFHYNVGDIKNCTTNPAIEKKTTHFSVDQAVDLAIFIHLFAFFNYCFKIRLTYRN